MYLGSFDFGKLDMTPESGWDKTNRGKESVDLFSAKNLSSINRCWYSITPGVRDWEKGMHQFKGNNECAISWRNIPALSFCSA
jgi:hypothetical protein